MSPLLDLRWPRRFATRIAGRFARINSRESIRRKKTLFFSPVLLQKLVGDFFDFSQGNLENLVGKFVGNFPGIFSDPQNKGSKISGLRENFGAFFVRKFVARKKSFVQNSLCRRATLTYFHNVRAIRANHLKSAIRTFYPPPPEAQFAKKGFGSGTLKRFARIGRFARIDSNRFARIGPSKSWTSTSSSVLYLVK